VALAAKAQINKPKAEKVTQVKREREQEQECASRTEKQKV
jgi:hypothetical protein